MTRLKIVFSKSDELPLVSTYIQDAIIPIRDMTFLPDERRFIAIINRFKWEKLIQTSSSHDDTSEDNTSDETNPPSCYERTHSGLRIEGVTAVRRCNIDLCDRTLLLSLLTITSDEKGLLLLFAGSPSLLLETKTWCGQLEDLGDPWPTFLKPHHDHEGE